MAMRLSRIMSGLLFALGVACTLYPLASNALFQLAQLQVTHEYRTTLQAQDPAQVEARWQAACAYNQALALGGELPPVPFASVEVAGVCRIERLGIEVAVYPSSTEEALAQGAGIVPGSALPVGGEGTRCVLAGHTGLPAGQVFDRLGDAQPGDLVELEVLGHQLTYQVKGVEVVLPSQAEALVPIPGEDWLTLVTCTPYGVNSHRLLVHAQRCEPAGDLGVVRPQHLALFATAPLVIGLLAVKKRSLMVSSRELRHRLASRVFRQS